MTLLIASLLYILLGCRRGCRMEKVTFSVKSGGEPLYPFLSRTTYGNFNDNPSSTVRTQQLQCINYTKENCNLKLEERRRKKAKQRASTAPYSVTNPWR